MFDTIQLDSTQWGSELAAGDPIPDNPIAGDPIPGMDAGLAELAGEELGHWSAASLSTRLVALVELRERLDAETFRTTAAWHHRRAWEADGSLSPVAWLTHRAPLAAPDAKHLVKTAKTVHKAPLLAAALASGITTSAHVGALARVMSARRAPLLATHDEVLTKQAERLSIRDFTTLVRRWAALADDQLSGDDHDDHQPHNELHAAVTMDGRVNGTFDMDPIAGVRFLSTLDHLAPPYPVDAPDGARTLSQRRGDALNDLAAWYHQGTTPGGNPPSLDVVVDIATLNGESPHLVQRRCDLEGIGPVTLATLQQIACGATLTRLVTAGDSIILDMGHKTRLATPAQTRAVRVRDTGCIFPSCDRPAQWCDIHHIKPYAQGGATKIENMACLCRRHHTLIHNSKWTIETNPDGTYTARHPTRAP